jgi:hypothetical protein
LTVHLVSKKEARPDVTSGLTSEAVRQMVRKVKTPQQMAQIAEDLLLALNLVCDEFENQFPVEYTAWMRADDVVHMDAGKDLVCQADTDDTEWTDDPAQVTCPKCLRLMQNAHGGGV